MKSLLKLSGLLALPLVLLVLAGCRSADNFDVKVQNPNDVVIETDSIAITRQELFEKVSTGSYNAALFELIDWVDYIVLSDLFEVDEELLSESLENFTSLRTEDELNEFLISRGFATMDEVIVSFTIDQLRNTAILEAVEIDEEAILQAYQEWFIPHEDAQESDEEQEIPEFNEVREDIEAYLTNNLMSDHHFRELTLANHRADAGMRFFSNYFESRYFEYLDWFNIDATDLTSSEYSPKPTSEKNVIVAVRSDYLTADELYDVAVIRTALVQGMDGSTPVLSFVDFILLEENFEGDREEVRTNINNMKINLLDNFYPTMAMQGLNNDQEIFDHFMRLHLQEIAFFEMFGSPSDAELERWEAIYRPEREAFHILVATEEDAIGLIEELKEANDEDLDNLFFELAFQYSSAQTSVNGGNLGFIGLPSDLSLALEEAIFDLEVGEFTVEPVEDRDGYHIVYVSREADPLSGNQLRNHLVDVHLQHHRNPAFLNSILINLRSFSNFTINDERLLEQYELIVSNNNLRLSELSE